MPFRDHSGPEGEGPQTGRGTGICGDGKAVNDSGFGRGTGRGRGQAGGRGQTGRRGQAGGRGTGRRGAGGGGRGFGGSGRGRGRGTKQGGSWMSRRLDNLQSAVENLADRMDSKEKGE